MLSLFNKYKFAVLLLLSAGVVWNIFQIRPLLSEWIKSPNYLRSSVSAFFNSDSLLKIEETRWNAFSDNREDLLSKLFFNKVYYLIDKAFDYTTFLSPRYYFQSGDSTKFSPPGVEPIAGILFPFFVFGVLKLINKGEYRPIYLAAVFSFFAFLLGQKTMAFLIPVLILYIYIASKSIEKRYAVIATVFMIYILGRLVWLIS